MPDMQPFTKSTSSTQHTPDVLRQFSADYFRFFGADVQCVNRRKMGPLRISLPTALTEYFGKEALTLVFRQDDLHGEGAHPGAELVAIGSRLFDNMLAYLNRRSALTVQRLPSRFGGGDELLQAVRPLNASVARLTMQEQEHELIIFTWRITYRADDKQEEMYTVALDESGTRVLLNGEPNAPDDAPNLDTLLSDAEPIPPQPNEDGQPVAPKLPPMTHLARLAEAARKYAIYHADVRCVEHEAEIQTRLYKTLNRLHTYYNQQIEEVYDAHDPEGEKRLALETDLQRKLAEEVENHRLRVDVRLVGYAILRVPVAVAELSLNDGQRETTLRIRRNRYTGALRRPPCHACAQETATIAIDRNGHVTCDTCVQQCDSCLEILCAECGVEPCSVCEKSNCDACGQFCWACAARACADHVSRCPICQDMVCHACQTECAHCAVRQCRSHLRADSVLRVDGVPALVCADCAVRCPHCQQYSVQVDTCAASGQRFCANCLATCSDCGRTVGPGFYHINRADSRPYCQDCLTVCPTCQTPTATVLACDVCGTDCCAECSATCAECGARGCAEHTQRVDACGHVFCTTHRVQCGVGQEIVCPACNEPCGICDRHFCADHTTTCQLCRCTYCRECVRSQTGLCDTCATIDKDGVAVYLADEAIAAHPDVAPLVHSYRWQRTGNLRYTIYLGKGPFNTGALVLVQSEPADDEDPVLVARKLTSIDQYWRRY